MGAVRDITLGTLGVAAPGTTPLSTLGGAVLTGTTVSVTAIGGGGEDALSVFATTVRVAPVSVSTCTGVGADGDMGLVRARATSCGDLLRRTHMVATTPISAAAPTPLQSCGAIGARSGFVPHHLHCPNDSG